MLFGQKVEPGGSYDLMTIPYISESDIQHSLLKGTLRNKLSNGEITVTDSNINLTQYSPEFTAFLQKAGINVGLSPVGAAGVTNITGLSQLNDAVIPNGTAVSVADMQSAFMLNTTSTATVDGTNIVATLSGTGRWIRNFSKNALWGIQYSWYVDSVNGDDGNDGATSGTALATMAECERRMTGNVYRSQVTINVLNDVNEHDVMIGGKHPQFMWVQGIQTTIATGTFTAITDWDHDPSDGYVAAGRFTDSALSGDWSVAGPGGTSLIDKKIVLTDGPDEGAFAYIIEDTGSPKEAYISPWLPFASVTEALPTPGTGYKVVDMPNIYGTVTIQNSNYMVFLGNLIMHGTPAEWWQSMEATGNFAIFGCIFAGDGTTQNGPTVGPARVSGFYNCYFLEGLAAYNARVEIWGGAFKKLGIHHLDKSILWVLGPMVMFNTTQAINLSPRYGSHIFIAGSKGSIGVINIGSNTSGAVIYLRDFCTLRCTGPMYSIGGSTGVGLFLESGAGAIWGPLSSDANTKFYFESATDFSIGGTTKTIAEIGTGGFVEPSNGAKVVNSP